MKSAINGYNKKCAQADAGIRPLHRPRSFETEKRRQEKLMSTTSWYRPHIAVGFYPSTPNQELAQKIQAFVDQETKQIGIKTKIIETGGVNWKSQAVKLDLTGCIFPGCWPCESGETGGSHTRRGPVYSATCTICARDDITASYDGESGFSAYNRFERHKADIRNKNTSNAFARHLDKYYQDRLQDHSVFKVKVEKTFKKCLDRQVTEGINIFNSSADVQMNDKSEWHLPSVQRTTTTNEIRSNRHPGQN